jgi:hypothetical protein
MVYAGGHGHGVCPLAIMVLRCAATDSVVEVSLWRPTHADDEAIVMNGAPGFEAS